MSFLNRSDDAAWTENYMQQEIDKLKAELEKADFFIACLESGGVDNWEWYSESLQEYWEKYGD